MALGLLLSFIFYSLFSWVILFRDAWTIEVLETKFYPNLAVTISQIQSFLANFKLNTVPTVFFALFVLVAFAVYFSQLSKKIAVSKIILFTVIFQTVVLFSYPILSTDVLNYILSDRIDVVYHENVWKARPREFTADPYFYLVYPVYPQNDWSNQARIYGPVNQFIYSAVARISGDDFLVNLGAHKAIVFAFNLATLILIFFILKKHFPAKLNFGLLFVFWNPLFILETVGSGHNDILMVFFLLLSYLFFLRKSPILTAVSLVLAAHVKSTALLAFPIYAAVFLGRDFRSVIKFALVFLGLYSLIFSTMDIDAFKLVTRTAYSTTLYWQSLPQQLSKINPFLPKLLTPLFLAFFAFQCLRCAIYRKIDPLLTYGQTYFVYLLFALGAYWNWYSLWVLTAFAFLGWGRQTRSAAAFTFSSALAYPLYWLSLRFNFTHPLWPVIIYLVIAVIPVFVYLHDKKN